MNIIKHHSRSSAYWDDGAYESLYDIYQSAYETYEEEYDRCEQLLEDITNEDLESGEYETPPEPNYDPVALAWSNVVAAQYKYDKIISDEQKLIELNEEYEDLVRDTKGLARLFRLYKTPHWHRA